MKIAKLFIGLCLAFFILSSYADDAQTADSTGSQKTLIDPQDKETPDDNQYDPDPSNISKDFDKSGDVFHDKAN